MVIVREFHGLPEGFAAVEAEAGEGVGFGEFLDVFALEAGFVLELLDGGEVADALQCEGDGVGGVFAEAFDQAIAQPKYRVWPSVAPRSGSPRCWVHIRWQDGDAVGFGIADDLGGGVEAHRLAVEQGAGEVGGVVVLDPGGGVDQQGEGGGVAFGEAVFAEAADLHEAVFGEFAGVAVARACRR